MGVGTQGADERPDRRRGPVAAEVPAGAEVVKLQQARPRSQIITVGKGEAFYIEGAKGFGKTRLVMAFCATASSVVVFDPTNRADEWPAFGLAHGFVISDDPEDIRRYPKVIMRVNQLWLEDRAGWRRPGTPGWNWTRCLTYVFDRGNTYVVIEEAIQTLPALGPHPVARRILTQGRGNDLRSFVMLQGMIGVDTMGPRLAEHFVAFMTKHAGDLQAIYDNRRVDPTPLTQLAHLERGKLIAGAGGSRKMFAYHRLGSDQWLLCDPLQDYFVGSKRTTSRAPARSEETT